MTSDPSQHTILVVEDEEQYAKIIAMMLEMAGYNALTAGDGMEGLDSARKNKPDLILCDITMPNLDGYGFLKQLKAESSLAEIPFIFLTGHSDKKDMRAGMQLGADDYLTKPFGEEELLNAVQARLEKRKALREFYESEFDDVRMTVVNTLPHEFRTPMASILGFSEMLMNEPEYNEDQVKWIGTMIHSAGRRLHRLLENVALMAQVRLWMNDPKKIAELQGVPETTVVDYARATAEKIMAEHERTAAIQISGLDLCVKISSVHLVKILEEVFDNALKFSKPGTEVSVVLQESDGEGTIIVHDQGKGMSREHIANLSAFRQFERTYFEQQGVGLGLAIVQSLLEIYGGRFTIMSEEGKGTSVFVSLPRAAE